MGDDLRNIPQHFILCHVHFSAMMGEYFYEKMEDPDWAKAHLGWLPLVSLVVFITAFSIGYGPIPWLMIGECSVVAPLESSVTTM